MPTRKNMTQEDCPDMLHEPIAAYGENLNALKLEALEAIMNCTACEPLLETIAYLKQLSTKKNTPPCQFTVEELKEQLKISMAQFKSGDYITHEELCSRKPTWR